MSVINTNVNSLVAQNAVNINARNLSRAMEQLSTGKRINGASDDAAGLSIAQVMTSQIRGLNQAIRNANDGISLTQTAEGSLSAIQDNLQRIRELSVQSANSGNTTSDRASLNLEAQQLISEIDRVATNTTFNGSKLLDGSFSTQDFQVGAGSDVSDRITISISSAKAGALGTVGGTTTTRSTTTAVQVTAGALAAGDLAIKGFAIGATVSDGLSSSGSNESAIAKANAINAHAYRELACPHTILKLESYSNGGVDYVSAFSEYQTNPPLYVKTLFNVDTIAVNVLKINGMETVV
jgi:flagellin